MRINNNMSAVLTNNQLLGTEDSLSDVMEKLSSGFRINHASDDPSGIAIAGNMQAQIDGLDQASTNGEDGISVLQTAEGALGEVTDMVQRMRELAVQAANGTNSTSERESIQMEIDSLLEEIDRISSTTQFNSINLLDGSLDCRTYATTAATRIQTSNTVPAGSYSLTISAAAVQAKITATAAPASTVTQYSENNLTNTRSTTVGNIPASEGLSFTKFIDSQTWSVTTAQDIYTDEGTYDKTVTTTSSGVGLAISGTISINGYTTTIAQGSTGEEVYEALRIACEYGSAEISDPTDLLSISSIKYGKDAYISLDFSSEEFAKALGFTDYTTKTDDDGNVVTAIKYTGVDAKIKLEKKYETDTDGKIVYGADGKPKKTDSDFGMQATVSYDGNHITISDTDGFELSFKAKTDYTGDITFNVTDIGSMTLQVGANEGQDMDVRIRSVSTEYMYIDDLDVTKMDGPEDAMNKLDDALTYVTSLRSQLGAYENRLDHTTTSLDETSENMTSAISRIEDADMATTMVEYTKLNVLEQAATSALAQANELPQLALQLLQ